MTRCLAMIKEDLSDKFQSTFMERGANTLVNILGPNIEDDCETVGTLIREMIPGALLNFRIISDLGRGYFMVEIELKNSDMI